MPILDAIKVKNTNNIQAIELISLKKSTKGNF
jgi:hypothetical protein